MVVVVVDMDVKRLEDLCGGEECCWSERKGITDEDGGGEVGSHEVCLVVFRGVRCVVEVVNRVRLV